MPFGAHILSSLETALAECFNYHNALRDFLIRSGVPTQTLDAARSRAEERTKNSPRGWKTPPKRFIVQELLNELSSTGQDGDRRVAELVTAVVKGHFPEASQRALDAIEALRSFQQNDRREKDELERKRREEALERERHAERQREAQIAARLQARDKLREKFLNLNQQSDPQARGYMLEAFLNEFFEFEDLAPRGSFKLLGEQIDGSFAWGNRIHIIEAKWVRDPVAGNGFSSLMYKIQGKTVDTRGLFISINGYSPEAIKGLHQKGELRFVCIDGAHIMRCLEASGNFQRLLETVWRHAGETGEAYMPVSQMKSK